MRYNFGIGKSDIFYFALNNMPSGKTHDAITFLLTIPVFFAISTFANGISTAAFATGSFLFGGLMFGPDLDTQSNQFYRWSIFSFLWMPYRLIFRHRSRWSHGLIFGTFFRIIYFFGVLSLAALFIVFVVLICTGGEMPGILQFFDAWRAIGNFSRETFGASIFIYVFAGLWLGAASHTLTDLSVSYIKTGKLGEFL